MAGSVNASIASFNFSEVESRLASINNSITAVNFTGLRVSLAALNGSLATSFVNAITLQLLRDFEQFRFGLMTNLSAAVRDFSTVSKGYCVSASAIACASAGDCPGGACNNVGAYRCRDAPATLCPLGDAACGSNDACLVDPSRALILKAAIQNVAVAPSGSVPAMTDTRAQLAAVTANLNGVDVAGMRITVELALANAAAVAPSSMLNSLATLNGSLFAFDTSSITSQLAGVEATLAGLSFGDLYDQLTSVNGTVTDMRVQSRALVQQAQDGIGILSTLLNDRLGSYVTQLSAPALNAALATGGTAALLGAVLGIVQDAYDFIGSSQTFISLPALALLQQLPNDTINKITSTGAYAGYLNAGVLNWGLSLIDFVNLVSPASPDAAQVFVDVNGAGYANNAVCLSDACIARTADAYSEQTLEQLTGSLVPMSITPLALLSLFWVFPLAVTVCAWMSLASPFMCKDPRWQKVRD